MTTPYIQSLIGIDALHLYNIRYDGCDYDLLDYKVAYSEGVKHRLFPVVDPDMRQTVEYIKIIDNYIFSDIIINVVRLPNGGRKIYVDLTLKVHYINGNNLNNIKVKKYKHYLDVVRNYISDTYGIFLNFATAQIKSMEINVNLLLEHRFNEYARVMHHLLFLIPGIEQLSEIRINEKKLKKSKKITSVYKETHSLTVENNQCKIKIYDKRREMRKHDNYDIGMDLMRIEVTLKTPGKIKSALGTNILRDIDNDIVINYFYNKFRVNYYGQHEKWCVQNKKDLQEKVQEHSKPYRPWQHDMLTECLNYENQYGAIMLFDINDMDEVIPKDKHNNRARTIAAFYHHKKVADIFFMNDREKLAEIIRKLDDAYADSKTTSTDDV